MKELFTFEGLKVTILGWARSGISAARLAEKLGATVFVSEARGKEELSSEAQCEIARYAHETGGNTRAALDADLLILSPGIPLTHPLLREYTGKIWSELELAWRAMPCKVIAITGTNGKTTTTTLIGKILADGYAAGKTHVAGNIGVAATEIPLKAEANDLCVLELSSFQLETIEKFRPEIAVFLNLRSDHLDRYSSIEEYAEAKKRIFMNMTSGDTAVLNVDDEYTRRMAKGLSGFRTITVSAHGPADYTLVPEYTPSIMDAVKAPENILSAVAVAELVGVPRESVLKTLSAFKGLRHRIEFVGAIGGSSFYDDSKATNVHSVEAAIKRLDAPIVVIMGGKDKGENYAEIRELVAAKCRAVVSYGEAAERIQSILGGEIVRKFDDAVRRAHELAGGDASVLLSPACSSYDQFRDYVARGDRFKAMYEALAAEAGAR